MTTNTGKIVKKVLDDIIATGNLPRAVRANVISGPICRYIKSSWNHDMVQIGEETYQLIDNIAEPSEMNQNDFVENMTKMTFGRYLLQEDRKVYAEAKASLPTKYEKTLFDLVNYVRVYTQTKFVLDMIPFAQWWKHIESRPATKVVEYWFLNGITADSDTIDLIDIFDELQYVYDLGPTIEIVKKLAKLLPYEDAESDAESYRNPFEGEEAGDSRPDESFVSPDEAVAREATREVSFKKTPSPTEVDGKGMIDFYDKKLFSTKARPAKKDLIRVANVQKIIEPIFEAKSILIATKEPQPRLDRRSLGMSAFTKTITFAEPAILSRGCVNISVIFDCSGSMSSAVQDGRIFLYALNNMATKGYVKGYVFFTSGSGYMVKKFPMDDTEIANVCAFSGSEGIAEVLKEQTMLLKKSQLVVCYTDADITDSPWKKEFYTGQGVNPIGLYVGCESARPQLDTYFSKNYIQPTVEDLCYGLLEYLKATPMAIKR
jgi:hypothetical protein